MSLFLHYLGMSYLLEGIELTLEVTALGLGGGLILGLILAGMQLSRFWLLAAIARAYTVIFRGTPLILQMVFAYDALPHIGIKLPAVLAAGLALACNEAPFIAEMLRAGVLGVDRGQVTAGQALGMTPSVLMRRVIAPQAIRTMIPAFGNEAVSALKNSSLASVVAVQELTLRSTQLASSTFDFFSIFFASGLLYLVLTFAISVIQLFVECLRDLDLTIRVGEVVALLGPSGSGKSTLLRCINHLESWDAGTVRVGGRRLGFDDDGKLLSPRAIANERATVGVGMVFQQFNLFAHLSAKENVAGPLRWVHGMNRIDADRRAAELLDRVGLSHRADALPRHLSGGQQQRVAIARALAPNPSVLLLDEPTSALDPELVNEVLEVIRRLAIDDGLTMIIATHQIRFADEVADRVAFLSGGRIVEEGPAHDVLSNPRNPLTARFLSVMEADKVPEAVR